MRHIVTLLAGAMGSLLVATAVECQTQTAAADAAAAPSGAARATTDPAANTAGDAKLPTTREILEKADKAMGGSEAWKKVSTRYMKGVYQPEDSSAFIGVEILQKSPDKLLYKLKFPNDIVVRDVSDGKSAWIEDSRGGYHEFEGAALKARLKRGEYVNQGAAFLLAATGKVTGAEKIGARTLYVIEFSPEKNELTRMFFDAESGYVIHTEETFTTPGGPYTVKMDLDDYRDVDGLKYAFRMKRVEKGVVFNIRLTQVKNNAPIDDTVFLKPESAPR